MVRVAAEFGRDDFFQFFLYRVRRVAGGQGRAVGHAEQMRINGDCFVAKGDVQNDIRGLAPHAG